MALPALPVSNAAVARQEVRANIADAQNLDQVNLSNLRNVFLDSIDQTLQKMFDLQKNAFDQEMLDRQKQYAKEQADRRKPGWKYVETANEMVPPRLENLALRNLLMALAGLSALSGTYLGLRGFINPLKNAKLAMSALKLIYLEPINFFKNLGVKVANLLKVDVAFDNLKRFFLKNATINYLFGGARNLDTGRFQQAGLIPRIIDLASEKVSNFFKLLKLPTLSGLKGRSGAFATIKGFFSRVLSPIKAVSDFITESKIFNNPLIKGGIAFFKTVFTRLLFPIGLLISGFEGIKKALGSDEKTLVGKLIDGTTTALADFFGTPLDLLKDGLTFLLRKALGVDLDENGNVAGGEGAAGKVIQSLIDFNFEETLKSLLMAPFKFVKAIIKSIKALFTGEEDPLKYIRNPVLDILEPIIKFFGDVKDWIVSQIKDINVLGDLFKTDEDLINDEIAEINAKLNEQATVKQSIKDIDTQIAQLKIDRPSGVNREVAFLKNQKSELELQALKLASEQNDESKIAERKILEARLAELEETKKQDDQVALLIEKLDAVATSSGNGAAENFRAMEDKISSGQSQFMANSITNAPQTTINSSESFFNDQKVDPRGEVDYMNYAPNK